MARWDIKTSVDNKECRIRADAVGYLRMTPRQCYQALCSPEGAEIFRVERRVPCGVSGDLIHEEVTFLAPMRVLFWKRWARTHVRQCIDLGQEETTIAVSFELIQSDLMSKLEGSWSFTLVRPGRASSDGSSDEDDSGDGGWPLSRVQYTFCMWPKGVPPGMRRLPGLMDAVRGAVGRESAQLMDKLAYIESKMAYPGMPVALALRAAAGAVHRAGSFKKLVSLADSDAGLATAAAAAAAGAAATAASEGSSDGGDAAVVVVAAGRRDAASVVAHRLSLCCSSVRSSLDWQGEQAPGAAAAAAAAAGGGAVADDDGASSTGYSDYLTASEGGGSDWGDLGTLRDLDAFNSGGQGDLYSRDQSYGAAAATVTTCIAAKEGTARRGMMAVVAAALGSNRLA